MRQTAGHPFGNYRLIRKVGEGGMGEVYLALQETTAGVRRRVALKRLLPEVAGDRESIRMFLQEMSLVARLSHPAVVHTYDFGQVDGAYFIVMEFIDGVSLSDLLRRHASGLPPGSALRIAIDVCGALQHAHEIRDDADRPMGVVHRDVSPQNILVSAEGGVKLADFGIARIAASSEHSRAMVVKGKFAYMSPEQTRGEAADRRTDVFALGAVLYEMLTGIRAFARADSEQTVEAVRTLEPEPAHHVRPNVPEALSAIASRALAKAREERYQTAAEMQLALEQGGARLGLVASPVLLATLVQSACDAEPAPPHETGLETELVPTVAAPSPREVRAAPRRARRTGETVRVAGEASAPVERAPETLRGVGSPPQTMVAPAAEDDPMPVVPGKAARGHGKLALGAIAAATACVLVALVLLEAGRSEGPPATPMQQPAIQASAVRSSRPGEPRAASGPAHPAEPSPAPAAAALPAPDRLEAPAGAAALPAPDRVEAAAGAAPPAPREPVAAPAGPSRPVPARPRPVASSGATGRLLLVSEPEAVVRFRGRRICETPCTTPQLPAGTQSLLFVLRDGSRVSRTVRVPANDTARLRIVLR